MIPPAAETLWASLPMPAVAVDPGDRISCMNAAAELFLNVSSRLAVGRPVLDRLAFGAPIEDAFARARENGSPLFVDSAEVLPGRGATPILCSLRLAPVADAEGHVLALIEPGRMADRPGLGRPAGTPTRSAVGMAELLAHEIRNPLAGIIGAAQLLSTDIDEAGRELTGLIVDESRRVAALLDQVERFGGLRPPARREVNLHDVLACARNSAQAGLASRMRFIEEFDPSLPPAFADPDQLQQAFLNLLINAAQAAGEGGGTIRLRSFCDMSLRVRRRDGIGAAAPLQVEIVDDGPGLPPDIAEDVFDAFVSGRGNGAGLGLAIVSRIVAEHDGWISVESEPGRTAFRVSLPAAGRDEGS